MNKTGNTYRISGNFKSAILISVLKIYLRGQGKSKETMWELPQHSVRDAGGSDQGGSCRSKEVRLWISFETVNRIS